MIEKTLLEVFKNSMESADTIEKKYVLTKNQKAFKIISEEVNKFIKASKPITTVKDLEEYKQQLNKLCELVNSYKNITVRTENFFSTTDLTHCVRKKEKYLQENREHLSQEEIEKLEKEIEESKKEEELKKKNREFLYNRFEKILNSKKDLIVNLTIFPRDTRTIWDIRITFLPEKRVSFFYKWTWCSDGYGIRERTIIRENGKWYYQKYGERRRITQLIEKVDCWIS